MIQTNRQNNINLLSNLKEFISTKEIRNFKGKQRKLFRLIIVNAFYAAWTNNGYFFHECVAWLHMMIVYREADPAKIDGEFYEEKLKLGKKILYDNYFKIIKKENGQLIIDENELNNAVRFCKNFAENYFSRNQKMYLYDEIMKFWDLQKLYEPRIKNNNFSLLPCHWIDLEPFLYQVPIYTFPDYLAYQDMINIWNEAVEKNSKMSQLIKDCSRNDAQYFNLNYSFISLLKYSIVAAVHFVETYLFYFYYLCKLNKMFPQNKLINQNRLRSITDKQIIEDLVFKEFTNIPREIKGFYSEYKEILVIRDAIAHLSPFTGDNSNKSRIELAMISDINYTAKMLETCHNFVVCIDNFTKIGLLFWKDKMEHPDFTSLSVVRNLSLLRE